MTLWALHRHSALAGESALWALAVAVAAREWVGGPVTLPSAKSRVPLLHDPQDALPGGQQRRRRQRRGKREGGERGVGVGLGGGEGRGQGGQAYESRARERRGAGGMGGAERVSLVGARVEIVQVEVVGRVQSGFDRFFIKVQAAPRVGGRGKGRGGWGGLGQREGCVCACFVRVCTNI